MMAVRVKKKRGKPVSRLGDFRVSAFLMGLGAACSYAVRC